jgi:hypothetical protein
MINITITRLNFIASVRRLLLLVCFFINGTNQLFAEGEIVSFAENFALNFYGNFNMVDFASKENRRYTSASPWSIGLGIRYKNISARIFLPLWFDNNPFDIQLNSYYEKVFYEFSFRQYKRFYRDQDDSGDKHPVSGFDILSTGILAGWIQNNKRHSLSSVYNLDKKQIESNGSFLYGFGVFYTSINSTGEDSPGYSERQHLVYFGPAGGYSYTWVFPHDIFCNVNLTAGFNMGIDALSGNILFVPQIMPKFTVGYHGKSWSVNVIGGCTYTNILWPDKGFDSFLAATMTLAFSKRF